MTLKKTLIAAALSLASMAAMAAPIVNDNVRPVTFGPGTAGETTLQSVLDSGLSGTNALTGQSTAGQWGSATTVPADILPALVLEQTSGATSQIFGIWFGTDDANILMYDLILGAAVSTNPSRQATLFIDNGYINVYGANCGNGTINCLEAWDARINPLMFGFYFKTSRETAFSIDNLSTLGAGEKTRFLAYNDSNTNWMFAFEDGSDYDYNDMVVKVESLKAVPEPGSLALLGAGLLGLAVLRRRKA